MKYEYWSFTNSGNIYLIELTPDRKQRRVIKYVYLKDNRRVIPLNSWDTTSEELLYRTGFTSSVKTTTKEEAFLELL